MLAKQFGSLVKDGRVQKGLKQVELARAAKVSRTVLSRLEQGTARVVQTDILDRIFAVLEVRPKMVEAGVADEARTQARLEQQRNLEERRSRHLRLAIGLAIDEAAATEMIARAKQRVELWRRKRACSAYYIERWSELLNLPPRRMAKEMASLGAWEDALFQNSPWSFGHATT